MAISASIRFGSCSWESVRVEEIKTQPETDVVRACMIQNEYQLARMFSLFQILSPCASRGWPASRSVSIDAGSLEKVSLHQQNV